MFVPGYASALLYRSEPTFDAPTVIVRPMTDPLQDLSASARRVVEELERTTRSAIADLSAEDALDALDISREVLLRIANELRHG